MKNTEFYSSELIFIHIIRDDKEIKVETPNEKEWEKYPNINLIHRDEWERGPAFKYIPKKYAESMVNRGEIKISPINHFSDTALHEESIGDEEEGATTVEARNFRVSPEEEIIEGQEAPGLREYFQQAGLATAEGVVTRGESIRVIHPLPFYIYCMSLEGSRRLLIDYYANGTGKDALVRINNPTEFLKRISTQLDQQGMMRKAMAAPCQYVGEPVDFRNMEKILLPLVKKESHSWQKELRAMWLPHSEPTEPLTQEYEGIAELCEIEETLSDDEKEKIEARQRQSG